MFILLNILGRTNGIHTVTYLKNIGIHNIIFSFIISTFRNLNFNFLKEHAYISYQVKLFAESKFNIVQNEN